MIENKLIECYKRAMEIHKEEFGEDSEAIDLYKITIELIEEIQQYRAIGTVEECWEARKKQGKVCEPEYLGENVAIGCRDGKCDCGNIVRSYQNFCDDCGIKLEWDCVRG